MNIIQFFIEVHKNTTDIKNLIIETFKNASSNPTIYSTEIIREWNLQKPNLRSLYNDQDLVAFQIRENIKYYIFDSSITHVSNSNRITLDLLIVSNVEDIDYSINIVIKDIKEKLNSGTIKVLRQSGIFLFPYNSSNEDIYESDHKLKAIFYKKSPNIWEKLRFIIVLVITISLMIFHKYGNPTTDLASILISLYTAGIIFLITEFLIKGVPMIYYILNKNYSISINDLSNCIQPHHPMLYSANTEASVLVSPPEDDMI
jgi:hypothetical protein